MMENSLDTKSAYKNEVVTNCCPVCRSQIKLFPINNEEIMQMCPNVKCTYPFLPEDTLYIGKKGVSNKVADDSVSEQLSSGPTSVTYQTSEPDQGFDIEAFLAEQCVPIQEDNLESLAEIMEDLLKATGSFSFDANR